MALTEAGETYLARVEPVLDEIERARDEAARLAAGPAGTLRLTASVAFGEAVLVPRLPALRAAHPDLALDLVLTDAPLDLIEARIDLAVRHARPEALGLIVQRLRPVAYRLVAAPGLAPPARPEDLGPVLRLSLPGHRDRWRFEGPRDVAVPVAGPITVSAPIALRRAALEALGPALLADWMVDADIAAGRLVRWFPDWTVSAGEDAAIWLVQPSRAFVPGKTRAAIDWLRG